MVRLGISGLSILLSLSACSEIQVPAGNSDAGVTADAMTGLDSDAMVGVCQIGAICDVETNVAFVTRSEQTPGSLGGLEGADEICNNAASMAGLSENNYVAWLSIQGMNAINRLGEASGWIRTDGRPFALSVSDLLDGNILYPLHLDEFGNAITGPPDVVTGTLPDGLAGTSGDCGGWEQEISGESPETGIAVSAGNEWTSAISSRRCNEMTRIYCFGTNFQTALELPQVEGRLAWVSSDINSGDSSIAQLNRMCTGDADTMSLDGEFVAFVATEGSSAAAQFDTEQATWVRSDGVVVWAKASDIGSTSPLAPIRLRLDGEVTPATQVWTGARNPGVVPMPDDNCDSWLASTSKGYVGQPSAVGTSFFQLPMKKNCSMAEAVYCLEK